MAGNKVTLTFAGDADALSKAAKQAEKATAGVADAAQKSSKDLTDASKSSSDLGTKMGHLGSAVSGASDALDAIGGSLDAVNNLQQAGYERASRLARAWNDAASAQQDLNEALNDGKRALLDQNQAQLDVQSAQLDVTDATKAYNQAVREHGKNSTEAQRALLDLKQANQDVASAQQDYNEALQDGNRATVDAQTAQLDLNDAQREAHPPELSTWAQDLQLVTPLLSAAVGVVGLLTAAQWLWNASLWASPITWIVLAVAALVAIIVIIATKTTWFQDLWNAAWGGIKKAASAVWDWISNTLWPGIVHVFTAIGSAILQPFRSAFNLVATAWNSTIGQLSWTVPDWVPKFGGNTISAPHLPHFHQGGIVPGGLGAETLAVLQAGERVSPGGGGHSEGTILIGSDGSDFGDFLVSEIRKAIDRRGGDAGRVLSSRRG